jgi:tyrosinase
MRYEALTGKLRYWDEPRDAGRFSSAGIFDAREGFGGGGEGEERCIRDGSILFRPWLVLQLRRADGREREGPFADYRLHQGPGYAYEEHCISRAIDDNVSSYIGQDAIDECLSQPDFQRAWPCIETNPHTAGHRGVGGVMVS